MSLLEELRNEAIGSPKLASPRRTAFSVDLDNAIKLAEGEDEEEGGGEAAPPGADEEEGNGVPGLGENMHEEKDEGVQLPPELQQLLMMLLHNPQLMQMIMHGGGMPQEGMEGMGGAPVGGGEEEEEGAGGMPPQMAAAGA